MTFVSDLRSYQDDNRSTHHFRDAVLSYVHYRDNGEIAPVRIDPIGVGEYDGTSPRIEAEDYFKSVNASVGECPAGGFEMRNLTTDSALYYPKVINLRANSTMVFSAASANTGGSIKVHEGNPGGHLLGICQINSTGGWDKFQTFSCKLTNSEGTRDLCLVFEGVSGELLRLDWFGFPPS